MSNKNIQTCELQACIPFIYNVRPYVCMYVCVRQCMYMYVRVLYVRVTGKYINKCITTVICGKITKLPPEPKFDRFTPLTSLSDFLLGTRGELSILVISARIIRMISTRALVLKCSQNSATESH